MSGKRQFMFSVLCAALCTVLAACTTTGGTTTKKADSGARTPVVSQLQYKVGDWQKEFGYMGGSTAKLSPSPPQTPAKQAAFSSNQPLYGEIVLGAEKSDNRFLFAWDESKGTGSGYDTFYVDAKKSKDLTEALKVAARPGEKGNPMGEFPLIELSVSSGTETHPYHVWLTRCGTGTDHIHLYSAGYCEGTLALGKQNLKVVLFDRNCSGLFNDVRDVPKGIVKTQGPIYCSGDEFRMDADGDGEFKRLAYDTSELFPVAKFLAWGKACYELTVSPDGRSISVQETTAPCGNLAMVGPATFSAQLLGDAGAMKIANGQGRVKVPQGKYRLVNCDIQASDKAGKVWHAAGRGEWSQQPIEIVARKNTKMALGPPFTAEVKVTKQSSDVKFDLAITGKGGEKYSATSVSAVDSQGPPPKAKLEVRDASGKIVASADFEYG